jgi:hypothetical protein
MSKIYRCGDIEFSDRYVNLFEAFTGLYYYSTGKKIDFLNSKLDPLYDLSKSSLSDNYSSQIKYLRYEIPMSRFIVDQTIIEFFVKLEEERKNMKT